MKIKGYVNVGNPADNIDIEFDMPDNTTHAEAEKMFQQKVIQNTDWEWWIEDEPRYIDATHLKKIIRNAINRADTDLQKDVLRMLIEIIDKEPEAENIGWWRKDEEYGNNAVRCECSECGSQRIFHIEDGKIKADNYCRDCGASMRVEE